MHHRVRRAVPFAAVLALILGSIVPVTAQESDSVEVTGTIVLAPLSISIETVTVNFGNLDYKATPQEGSPAALGFLAPPENGGAYWVATTAIAIEVTSPSNWNSHVCRSAGSNLPSVGLRLLSGVPEDAVSAHSAFGGASTIGDCNDSSKLLWRVGSSGTDVQTRHLGTWVFSTDNPGLFSTTVTFSVATT